ncbi:MAG: HsdM family class I SAM-dependent methyltransferase [Planctomycetota bacterium]|jgi:SAM-dependent methyltransferase
MQRTASHTRRSAKKPLSSADLVRDFGAKAKVTREGVRALYEILVADEASEAGTALDRWKRLVSGACGRQVDRPSRGTEALAKRCGLSLRPLRPAEMLFAVETYYALVVNMLVWEVSAFWGDTPTPAERLSGVASVDRLRHEIEALQCGGPFEGSAAVGFSKDDPFSWHTAAWDEPLAETVRRLADRFRRYGPAVDRPRVRNGGDLLKALYEDLFPREMRHVLGEYYTPDWLARHVLDEADYCGRPDARLLDPACGSGTFLVAAIERVLARHERREIHGLNDPELVHKIVANVVGFDLNPLAVLSARANYLIALGGLARHAGPLTIPVFLRDSILDDANAAAPSGGLFDCVVGNPPWIAWDDLAADYREATKPLWQRYGLFSLSGSEARHGGGKKDLSMLMLYVAADRYLADRGQLAMVITQTALQTKGAGDGFRRFRLGDGGTPLRVVRVNDLADLRPFPGAANWTATIALEKGSPTAYPVPYVKWLLSKKTTEPEGTAKGRFLQRPCTAQPIDPSRPGSPWLIRPEGLKTDWARLVGPSDYRAHLGANSGGANGVYWVDVLGPADGGVLVRNVTRRGKRTVATVEHVVEPDLLYPLLRWADVGRYQAVAKTHLLLTQDVDTRRGVDEAAMRRRYPRTLAYLQRFAEVLTSRAAYKRYQHGGPFYSMYDVGRYTVAPVKVVWRRMDRRIRAAVVETLDHPLLGPRPIVPQETCVLIAADGADEAHYLCAVLNSAVVNFLVRSHSVRGGKGFGTPGMLDYLRLRRFERSDRRHARLADLSRSAHRAAGAGAQTGQFNDEIDRVVARLWEIDDQGLTAIRRELDD